MQPETTADRINEILNHPDVYPMVKGHLLGMLDASILIGHPQHLVFTSDLGGLIFVCHQPGIYELHTAMLREGRNAKGRAWARAVIDEVFTTSDAFEILTACPHSNPGARVAAQIMGFKREWETRPLYWHQGKTYPQDVFSLKIETWAANADHMRSVGKAFHEELHAQYKERGITIRTHDEDATHDLYAGIAVSMIRRQPFKAADFYNRWAIMNGYAKIMIEQLNPLIIDITESRLLLNPDGFEVL